MAKKTTKSKTLPAEVVAFLRNLDAAGVIVSLQAPHDAPDSKCQWETCNMTQVVICMTDFFDDGRGSEWFALVRWLRKTGRVTRSG